MDEEPEYKLIQAVNPTKVKIPIRDKFAKLTLSSNKKKQAEKVEDGIQLEKRKSASRNLMEQLNSDHISTGAISTVGYVNPLLRSDSSSQTGSMGNLEEYDIKADASNTMEPLQISDTLGSQNDNTVEKLSEQISMMFVSQKSSYQRSTDRKPKIPGVVGSVESECAMIYVSSTSDDDDSHNSSHSIITLSDSSLHDAGNVTFNYSLMTSDVPQSDNTLNGCLPNTLSNEKADRVEAFLRDVADDLKERAALVESSTEIEENVVLKENTSEKATKSRAQLLAALDTESMSESIGTEQQQFPIENFPPINKNHSFLSAIASIQKSISDHSLIDEINNSKRLASDETEANTFITNTSIYHDRSIISQTTDDSSILSSKSIGPEDSIVIPETSSEAELSNNLSNASASKELLASEPIPTERDQSLSDDSQLSQVGISMGNINISARINIKIQVSQMNETSSEGSSFISENKDTADNSTMSGTDDNGTTTSSPGMDGNTNVEICEQKQQAKYEESMQTPQGLKEMLVQDDNDQCKFVSRAETLLNELYGNSWQTPDVLHTLKRTETGGKESSVKQLTTKKKLQTQRTLRNKENIPTAFNTVEESGLDDFSIFRHNIAETNLNSTAMITPSQPKLRHHAVTEKKPTKKHQMGQDVGNTFKVPQTELRKQVVTTKSGRLVKERWRQLISDDSESDCANASDDSNIDRTDNQASDHSWSNESRSDEDSNLEIRKPNRTMRGRKNTSRKKNSKLVYLDLSRDEISVHEGTPSSPPANHDDTFKMRLQNVLDSCKYKEKPKLQAPSDNTVTTKRKLFTANFGYEDEEEPPRANTPKEYVKNATVDITEEIIDELDNINIFNAWEVVNKKLESVKTGKPIFKLTPPKSTPTSKKGECNITSNMPEGTPKTVRKNKNADGFFLPPCKQYGFLKSLDAQVSRMFCHPDALHFRDNYRQKKAELATILYNLYNEKLFDNKLEVLLVWNKKLLNTAGRCLNKKKLGARSSVVELSEKVLTSADRLRCTLLHELCHAATWIFNGEGGHGKTWKSWAHKANCIFPDIPKIGVCHKYDIEYKYTYRCTLCGAKSHAHSKSRKVENIRCLYCHGAIEIYLNKKDKDGNPIATPVREPTGFAKFVKEKYNQFKRPDLKHADVMKLLSNEFNALKLASNKN